MLSIVSWFWRPRANYRSQFSAKHVNVLASMVRRWYDKPHRMICVTDSPADIDRSIEIVPLWNDHANLPSPHGAGNPSCYRRLRAFSSEAAGIFGERFVSLDLDCVIVGDMAPLWDIDDDFKIWGDTAKLTPYNGSMWILRAGARRKVWDDFDPVKSPVLARKLGFFGSDQAWLGACLGPHEKKWTAADGVYSYRNHISRDRGRLPENARICFMHGQHDPWGPQCQRLRWVRENWR